MNDKDMCHIMVDIETLSTKSNATILSIGAVQFDLLGNVSALFHKGIDIDSCIKSGLHIDGNTIKWWLGQSSENIHRVVTIINSTPHNMLGAVLSEFKSVCSLMDMEKVCIWSHGSNFDLVVLENAYHAIGSTIWWKYKNVRDTRTLFDIANYTYKATGGHDALEDATNQAYGVLNAYQQLMKRGEKR